MMGEKQTASMVGPSGTTPQENTLVARSSVRVCLEENPERGPL
jgi:hypothetical protein